MDVSKQDQQWVTLLKRGTRKDISDFLDAYGSFVYHICYQVLGRSDESEEAAQDSFMKIIGNIETFDGKSAFKAWCYTLVYRTAIDHFRKKKSFSSVDQMPEQVAVDYADRGLEMKEQKTKVEYLLSLLDSESAMIVTLFYLEEKNIKEVAESMGLTESNVKIKLFRARKLMAEKSRWTDIEQ